MKVFEKKKKKIIVNNHDFLSVVDEGKLYIFRAYTGKFKNTLCEYKVDWSESHDINYYLPSIQKALILYASIDGWDYLRDKSRYIKTIKTKYEFEKIIRIGSHSHILEGIRFYHIKEMIFCLSGESMSNVEIINLILENDGVENTYKKYEGRYKNHKKVNQ